MAVDRTAEAKGSLRCSACDVCAALNVSSSFRHPIHAAHLLEERSDARIHAKQSPVALLVSNIDATDAGEEFLSQEILPGPFAANQIRKTFDNIGDTWR